MLDLFRDLARSEGRALLIVTHDPRVRTIADRIVAIRDGRLTQARLEPMSPTMFLGRVVLPAVGLAAGGQPSLALREDVHRIEPSRRAGQAAIDRRDRPSSGGSPPRGGSSPIPAPR